MATNRRITWRRATLDDVPRLARINRELIEDEWPGVSKSLSHLEERLRRWLTDPEYSATIFELDDAFAGYALVHLYPDEAYIRHFYIDPDFRGSGVGRFACEYLMRAVVLPGGRVSLDVLVSNNGGLQFWRAMGFREYSIVMERYSAPASERAA
jgi:ribosomal protein S18 acetylase RimI-like enzyme